METTIVYWGHIGIMEKKMETTIYNGDEKCVWTSLASLPDPCYLAKATAYKDLPGLLELRVPPRKIKILGYIGFRVLGFRGLRFRGLGV